MSTRAHRSKFIDRLFVMMHVTYGHFWSSQFVTDEMLRTAKAVWALKLATWSEASIEAGMDRCRRHYEKPATLSQFMNLLRTEPAHVDYKALPKPVVDEDKRRAEVEAMREALRRAV